VHTELRQEPASDEGPDYSDDEVADQPEAGPLYDLTGEPSCNDADHDYHEKTFTRHVHRRKLQVGVWRKLSACTVGARTLRAALACFLCKFAHIEKPLFRSNDQYCTDFGQATG
jgi:hypothetical protein